MDPPNMQARNELFQRLKPCCIKISQLAIRESDEPAVARELITLTKELLTTLNDQIHLDASALDDKLAEYVFFPLYNIFRQMDRYPMTLIENCIRCLTILIVHGWKSKVSAKLLQQILSLVTFILDGSPGSKQKRQLPEETALESYRALTAVFNTAQSAPGAAAGLTDQELMPALGHSITVILDGVVDGATAEIQQEALRTLEAAYATIKDDEALASFLPGTISSLVKVLSKPNSYKKMILARCLNMVQEVLTRVLGDIRTRSILAKGRGDQDGSKTPSDADKQKLLSPAWLKATTAQVKMALTTMMKLRNRDEPEVQEALEKLCVRLLDECHTSLANCQTILVETAMILGPEDDVVPSLSLKATSLKDLISIYPELENAVKTSVYNWSSSLSRIMLANDEDVKQQALHNLTKGISLMKALQIQSSTLEDSVSSNLRDSITAVMRDTKSSGSNQSDQTMLLEEVNASSVSRERTYNAVILAHTSQQRLRENMKDLIRTISSTSQGARLANSMLEYAQESNSDQQVAAMWLCLELIRSAHTSTADADAFLDLTAFNEPGENEDAAFDGLYTFAVQLLDSHSEVESVDWRLEAIALEVTSYAAQRAGRAFRPELIDVLFPVATFLGANNRGLQEHAIVTLNSIASSCEYKNVTELIIDNVDYMVNSVALRLNSLDISPASTQVLRMMIRLVGPRLIPYLDDAVESIFVALENYHGYPIFVETLFAVLKEAVDQGTRSDQLFLEDAKHSPVDHKKKRPLPTGLADLEHFLESRKKRKERDEEEDREHKVRRHPEIPWKAEESEERNEDEEDEEASRPPPEEEKPPSSPTYKLLLRISNLTQHYLTSPSPKLRRSLLELLTTASKGLAADEDAFLPLVNDIWPVVVSRLHDPETYIVVEACHTLAGLCAAAGDFLSTRFKTEWGDGLAAWCGKMKRQATDRKGNSTLVSSTPSSDASREIMLPIRSGSNSAPQSAAPVAYAHESGGLGQHASPARIWEAVIKLLTAILQYVRIDDVMFDAILDLLSDAMEQSEEVMDALETINADAVWLVRYQKGLIPKLPTPQLEGVDFTPM